MLTSKLTSVQRAVLREEEIIAYKASQLLLISYAKIFFKSVTKCQNYIKVK